MIVDLEECCTYQVVRRVLRLIFPLRNPMFVTYPSENAGVVEGAQGSGPGYNRRGLRSGEGDVKGREYRLLAGIGAR